MRRIVDIEWRVCALAGILIFASAELIQASLGVFYLLFTAGTWAAVAFQLHPEWFAGNRFARWLRR